jgi:hypothetical protein
LGFWRIEAMARHRSYSVAFKRQIAGEFITGDRDHRNPTPWLPAAK